MRNYQKVKFLVNKEKKMVTAYIDLIDLRNEFTSKKDDFVAESTWHRLLHGMYEGKYPTTFFAIAKCDPRDTFEVEVGRSVARVKLYKKIYTIRRKIVAGLFKELITNTQRCNEELAYSNMCLERAIEKEKEWKQEN